jgi:hypothetical protein
MIRIFDFLTTRFPTMRRLELLLTGRFSFLTSSTFLLPLTFYLLYRRALFKRTQILRVNHSRLGVLLRLWHVVISVIDQSNDTVAETGDEVAISQWMLELIPPSLNSSFWYQATWQLSLVKYGLDVVYSATNAWYNLFGNRYIGFPYLVHSKIHIRTYAQTHTEVRTLIHIQVGCLFYYILRPQAAADNCNTILGSPDLKYTVVTLLLHCCYTVVTLLLHCCYTVVTLLLHCCYTIVALLLHCCCTVVALLLHCCYTVVTLLLHCCYTIVTLLLHCCYTAVTLSLHCCSGT